MNDRKWIIAGLVVFLGLFTFPLWCNLATGGGPKPRLAPAKGECVERPDYMAANHMKLLYQWRDAVVREGKDTYTSQTRAGACQMSLTKTCLKCHTDREKFCDRCHSYADAQPNCWQCHVDLREK